MSNRGLEVLFANDEVGRALGAFIVTCQQVGLGVVEVTFAGLGKKPPVPKEMAHYLGVRLKMQEVTA